MVETLHHKTLKGAAWSFADSILRLGVSFVVGIILARLLSPDEYGLIGIITIFINVFNGIVDSGFSNALIRKKDANDTDYCTVFWSNLIVSVVLCAVLFFCAGLISDFFNRPQLRPLTQVMSVIVIINAFSIIQRTILVKCINFKTQTKASFFSTITSGVVGIAMAFAGCGVWSLVGQQLSAQILDSTLLWFYNQWIPKLKFSSKSFKDLFGFSWKLLVAGLLNSIWNELYQVVIGKKYSAATLGLYTRAQQFSNLFSSNITQVVQRVSYPALAEIQDDKVHLKDAYKRVIKVTMLVTFTLMLGLAGIANNFIYVLIGEKWMNCVPLLQILCFQMMLFPLHAINLNMLQVQGRSDLFLKLEIVKKIVAIIPLMLGIFISIYWMLITSVFTGIFAYYLNAYYSGPFLNYSIKEQVKDILPSFIISLSVGILVYVIGRIPLSPFVALPIQLIIGFGAHYLMCNRFKLQEFQEIRNIAMSYIKSK